ncbi:MAG: Ig-like domain-containing protein, partial [Thiomargarita sp.]|nr:Ig-like domain-containing protein [Thiomargarita sp.]
MLHKRLIYLLMFFSLLTGCLGGGGGSGEESTVNEQVVTLSLFITNNFQPADGNSSIEFTAVARDENNSPISDAEIYLSSESNFAKFSQFSGTTDEQGRFDTNISNTYAESFNIIATIGILQSEAINVTFITPTNQIILQANTEVLKTEDQTEVTITIYQETEILPNAEFNIAVSGSAQVENLPTKTDANGQATFTISNHIAEEVVITAISGEIKQTLSLFFGAKLELLLPNSVNATDEVELIALLKDANNKPLAGQTVSF